MKVDIFFPKTNPVIFDERIYRPRKDAISHESERIFIQQFSEKDLLSFQFSISCSGIYFVMPECTLSFIVNGTKYTYESISFDDGDTGTYPTFFSKGNKKTGEGVICFSILINEIKVNNNRIIHDGDTFFIEISSNGHVFTSNELTCCNNTERTKLLRYFQTSKEGETGFGTYFYYMPKGYEIRIPAEFLHVYQKADKSVFQSYKGNFNLVSALPYETVFLQIGLEIGIPDWLISNLNFIFHLDNKFIDGISYELTPDSEFEVEYADRYNNRFVTVELSKKEEDRISIDYSLNADATVRYENDKNNTGSLTIESDRVVYLSGTENFTNYSFSDVTVKSSSTISFNAQKNLTEKTIYTPVYVMDYLTNEILKTITLELPPSKTGLCFMNLCDTFIIRC